jgi:hypothetical protein
MNQSETHSYVISGKQLSDLRLAVKDLIFEYTLFIERMEMTEGSYFKRIKELKELREQTEYANLEMIRNKK